LPPPPPDPEATGEAPARGANGALFTDADRLAERYRRLTEAQGVQLGSKGRVPDFTREPSAPTPGGRPAPPAAEAPGPKKQESPRP
jgi:hypothetical protein